MPPFTSHEVRELIRKLVDSSHTVLFHVNGYCTASRGSKCIDPSEDQRRIDRRNEDIVKRCNKQSIDIEKSIFDFVELSLSPVGCSTVLSTNAYFVYRMLVKAACSTLFYVRGAIAADPQNNEPRKDPVVIIKGFNNTGTCLRKRHNGVFSGVLAPLMEIAENLVYTERKPGRCYIEKLRNKINVSDQVVEYMSIITDHGSNVDAFAPGFANICKGVLIAYFEPDLSPGHTVSNALYEINNHTDTMTKTAPPIRLSEEGVSKAVSVLVPSDASAQAKARVSDALRLFKYDNALHAMAAAVQFYLTSTPATISETQLRACKRLREALKNDIRSPAFQIPRFWPEQSLDPVASPGSTPKKKSSSKKRDRVSDTDE